MAHGFLSKWHEGVLIFNWLNVLMIYIYIYIFMLLMYVFKLVYVKHSKQHLELHGIVRVLSIRGEDVNGRYEGT